MRAVSGPGYTIPSESSRQLGNTASKRWLRLGAGLVAWVWITFPLGTLADRADASFPGANGKIAFTVSPSEGLEEIYVVEPDGTGLAAITDNSFYDASPSWSADGRRIVFDSERGKTSDIYTMRADGSRERRVVRSPGEDWGPSFSPNGKKVVFMSRRNRGVAMYVKKLGGSSAIRITPYDSPPSDPEWSPTGRWILAFSHASGRIYKVRADGSKRVALTTDLRASDPSWSPNGQQIVFSSFRSASGDVCDQSGPPARTCQSDIYVMARDGSDIRQLTTSPHSEWWPAFSPDGSKIVFSSDESDPSATDLWVMNADGSVPTYLAGSPGDWEYLASWQPLQ